MPGYACAEPTIPGSAHTLWWGEYDLVRARPGSGRGAESRQQPRAVTTFDLMPARPPEFEPPRREPETEPVPYPRVPMHPDEIEPRRPPEIAPPEPPHVDPHRHDLPSPDRPVR